MYGSILQSFAGVESPVKKELAKGAEIRNKLVHRLQGQAASLPVLATAKYGSFIAVESTSGLRDGSCDRTCCSRFAAITVKGEGGLPF